MKKLRLTNEEKKEFLMAILNKLNYTAGSGIEKFEIEDIKKSMTKIDGKIALPKVIINSDVYIKMLELIRQSPIEISWHGLVKRNKEENTYTIYDILVFPQINSATTTTADEKGFAEWQTKLIMDENFPLEDLRMHGHSHVNMQVFSSGVDDQYQEDILHKVEDGDYYLFLIMNKKMEICALLYDFDQQIMFDSKDIDIEIGTEYDIAYWAEEMIKEFCTEEKPVIKRGISYYGWDDYDPDNFYGGVTNTYNKKKGSITGKKDKPIQGGKKHGSK